MKLIPLGEWLPDQPSFNNPGLVVASNTYPGVRGYRPVKSYVQDSANVTETMLGAAAFTSPLGVVSIIGGGAANLYRIFGGQWQGIGGGFSTQGDGRWRFAQFGGLAIATNGADPMQKIDLATGSVSPLGGNPPKSKMLAVVKDFLVAGVLDGRTNELGWSAINNAEDWTFGQNQSDYQIMPSGGDINGLFGGEFGLILQRGRITRMEYVGGNEIFVINEISSNFGCVTPHSVVQHGQLGFFLSDNGFMKWDGATLTPIGSERIDRTFFAEYNRASWSLMSAATDVRNQVVCWSMGNKIFCYHWVLDRWTVINQAANIIFSGVTRSVTLDEQDMAVGAADDNLDSPGLASFDSEAFKGGDSAFYVITGGSALGRFTGSNMAPTWETGMLAGKKLQSVIRPETDAVSGITITTKGRPRIGNAPVVKAFSDLRPSGNMPIRSSERLTGLSMTIAAGTEWSYAQGIDIDPDLRR